ncbi:MAG: hypothetical protein J6D53_12645, partial [Blautia sp.]|nr:hypothetical protein [Blautia sp.]
PNTKGPSPCVPVSPLQSSIHVVLFIYKVAHFYLSPKKGLNYEEKDIISIMCSAQFIGNSRDGGGKHLYRTADKSLF